MSTVSYNAMLIKATDLHEYDKKVTILTCESGVVVANLRGIKKQTAKLKSAIQPFAFGQFDITKGVVTGFTSLADFSWLVGEYSNFVVATLICEISLTVSKSMQAGDVVGKILVAFKELLQGRLYTDVLIDFFAYTLRESGYGRDFSNFKVPSFVDFFENVFETKLKSAVQLLQL